jgi:hypothetical protein
LAPNDDAVILRTTDKVLNSAVTDEITNLTTIEANPLVERFPGAKSQQPCRRQITSNASNKPTDDTISMAMLCPRGARPCTPRR